MRLDHRGQEWRQRTQKTFYDLLDKFPNMKMEELRLYIRSTRAYPYDVLLFRKSNHSSTLRAFADVHRELVDQKSQSVLLHANMHNYDVPKEQWVLLNS